MVSIPIIGSTDKLARDIRSALAFYPPWFVKAAQISKIVVSSDEKVRSAIAMYEHGTRKLYVYSKIGGVLQKALGHELAHAVDDNFGQPHFFSSVPEWKRIHRNCGHFDLQSYAEQPLEYFADMTTKLFLLGPQKLAISSPNEVIFLTTWVFPTLQREFGS